MLWVGLVISIASQFCALEKILDILKSHCPSSLMSSHEQERGCSQLDLLTTTIYLQYTILQELPYVLKSYVQISSAMSYKTLQWTFVF